jgi:hypothetical protein
VTGEAEGHPGRDAYRAARALPTRYRGTLYRSRLEARWAVFFDRLGIVYEYEAQGFATGPDAYLPDFLLPAQALIAEVKPSVDIDPDGIAKLRNLVTARGIERGVVLTAFQPGEMTFLLIGPDGAGDTWDEDKATWMTCPDGYHYDVLSCPEIGCRHCPSEGGYWYYSERIEAASALARSFRFNRE